MPQEGVEADAERVLQLDRHFFTNLAIAEVAPEGFGGHEEVRREGVGAHLDDTAAAEQALVDDQPVAVADKEVAELVGDREPLAPERRRAVDQRQREVVEPSTETRDRLL